MQIVVSSAGAGRMLRQDLAERLPAGISAGIDFRSPEAWYTHLATRGGHADDVLAWRGHRLTFAVWQHLTELGSEPAQQVLRRIADSPAPARPQETARRIARLLRHYATHTPELLEAWLAGGNVSLDGTPLPDHRAWQPEPVRRVAESLGSDPVSSHRALVAAVATDPPAERTGVFAVAEPTRLVQDLVVAVAAASPLPVWHVVSPHLPAWAEPLAGTQSLLPGTPGPTTVSVHGSHGAARQAEVLRDELTRLFAEHPSLEPRHVAIVTPDLRQWWPVLQSAFSPTNHPQAHPGRQLRLQATGYQAERNAVLALVADALALGDGRATASEVVGLMTSPAVAPRWRLTDSAKVTELVSSAEVRWGIDARHRGTHGLGDLTQNTWVRGVDRLLAGLALPPGDPMLGVTGVEGVGTSDLHLIGAIAEVLSRLRRFVAESETDATVDEWVSRCRRLLEEVSGPAWDHEWMTVAGLAALAEVEAQVGTSSLSLTRAQFGRIVADLVREAPVRPAVGNGALQVIQAGDLLHVGFRVVCLLGVTDGRISKPADAVPVAGQPDERRLGLARLLAHARAAEHLVIVQQDRSAHTNLPLATPTAITWLLRELDAPPTRRQHPLSANSPQNFTAGQPLSFDRRAVVAARSLQAGNPTEAPTVTARRAAALHLPPSDVAHLSPADLAAFLKDPAKVFLRHAAGIRLITPPSTADEIPLTVGGLDGWGVRDRLLTAAMAGSAVTDAERAEFQREVLPPEQIGRRALEPLVEAVGGLWGRARDLWGAELVHHPIDLEVLGTRLRGSVATRGGAVVGLSVSGAPGPLLEPWVDLLLLAASGVRAECEVFLLRDDFGRRLPLRSSLRQPSAAEATSLLEHLVVGTRLARSRLIPLPLAPAWTWANASAAGESSRKAWALPLSSWDSPWRFRPDHWELFYAGPPSELFDDAPTPLDPGSAASGFEAWVASLIRPIVEAGQA